MRIAVVAAFATGPTELSAFDAALMQAGLHNFNLIGLSSVIPPASEVVELDGPASPSGQWGDRLYVVMAQRRASLRGATAWAGIGWVQDNAGKGLFVEHDASSREQVERDIHTSLEALATTRRERFGPVRTRLAGGTCEQSPVCALVVAVFPSSPWSARHRASTLVRNDAWKREDQAARDHTMSPA